MQNFNRPLPYTAISSCLEAYATIYLAEEPDCNAIKEAATQNITFQAVKIIDWMTGCNANSFKVELGVYTESFVGVVEDLFPAEPEVAASIQVGRLTSFVVAYNFEDEPIEAYNFGNIKP